MRDPLHRALKSTIEIGALQLPAQTSTTLNNPKTGAVIGDAPHPEDS
jgi:hypothetical protein